MVTHYIVQQTALKTEQNSLRYCTCNPFTSYSPLSLKHPPSSIISMLTQREIAIAEIVDEFLNGLRTSNPFFKWIRSLDTERSNLRVAEDEEDEYDSADLATSVIKKVALIQTRLVRDTSLRQEEDLRYAIEVATERAIASFHDNSVGDHMPDSD